MATGIFSLRLFLSIAATLCVKNDVPPISKKLSSIPTIGSFNSSIQTFAISFSIIVLGFLISGAESGRTYSGVGKLFLSIFPLGVIGNSSSQIYFEGNKISGKLFDKML